MIIDGRQIAKKIIGEVGIEFSKIEKPPFLAGVSIGTNSAIKSFLEIKKKVAEKIGVDFRIYEFAEDITNTEIIKKLEQVIKSRACGGMIIELPLPPHLNTQHILNLVPPEKDPDALSQKSQGAFYVGRSQILPPSVGALKIIFEENEIKLTGKKASIFGYGSLVGRPIVHWLTTQGVTVTILTEFSKDPTPYTLNSDLIVSGVGKANFITANMIKEGSVVIDFGYSKLDGKIVGDIDFENVSKKTSLITPPIGGMGPIVVATVIKNFVKLIQNKK